jgi:hypothetical protein
MSRLPASVLFLYSPTNHKILVNLPLQKAKKKKAFLARAAQNAFRPSWPRATGNKPGTGMVAKGKSLRLLAGRANRLSVECNGAKPHDASSDSPLLCCWCRHSLLHRRQPLDPPASHVTHCMHASETPERESVDWAGEVRARLLQLRSEHRHVLYEHTRTANTGPKARRALILRGYERGSSVSRTRNFFLIF